MDVKEHRLVLYDREEEYAQLMTEFLKKHKELPWEIRTYTDAGQLMCEEKRGSITMLVVAESVYSEEIKALQPTCIVVLNESGLVKWDRVHNINKYQQADYVLKALLEIYVDIVDVQLPRMGINTTTKFIGVYSPVRRCLQTSFAITMSRILAESRKTLYLNFEHYAGITELLPDMQTRDIADLLYFLTAEKDKFRLRLQAIIQHKGGLDYIPPMKAGQNLLPITAMEWMSLLQKLSELSEYEYVVLDLSENVQGLFDVLRMCTRVYTLTKEDRVAQSKLEQYEQVLSYYQYEDVLEKTTLCNIPQIRKLPDSLEQYTRGDLADYVRAQVKQLKGVEDGIHGNQKRASAEGSREDGLRQRIY